jgi:hypothetical protein
LSISRPQLSRPVLLCVLVHLLVRIDRLRQRRKDRLAKRKFSSKNLPRSNQDGVF